MRISNSSVSKVWKEVQAEKKKKLKNMKKAPNKLWYLLLWMALSKSVENVTKLPAIIVPMQCILTGVNMCIKMARLKQEISKKTNGVAIIQWSLFMFNKTTRFKPVDQNWKFFLYYKYLSNFIIIHAYFWLKRMIHHADEDWSCLYKMLECNSVRIWVTIGSSAQLLWHLA